MLTFNTDEEFESERNRLGGLLLLKGVDNISSGNEEYSDKLKTYSAGLKWGHLLVDSFHHNNKWLDAFNDSIEEICGYRMNSIGQFDKKALEYRNKLLYHLTCIVWEV